MVTLTITSNMMLDNNKVIKTQVLKLIVMWDSRIGVVVDFLHSWIRGVLTPKQTFIHEN